MKNKSELGTELDHKYDVEGIFLDVCKAVIGILLIGMVLYAAL